jgi:hypothetical protein
MINKCGVGRSKFQPAQPACPRRQTGLEQVNRSRVDGTILKFEYPTAFFTRTKCKMGSVIDGTVLAEPTGP